MTGALAFGNNWQKGDFGMTKGRDAIAISKQVIHRFHQTAHRAVVFTQRISSPRIDLLAGGNVGKNITATKTVDSLLRIADHEQGAATRLIDRLENLVLDWVGILKLVNQSNGVTLLQRSE